MTYPHHTTTTSSSTTTTTVEPSTTTSSTTTTVESTTTTEATTTTEVTTTTVAPTTTDAATTTDAPATTTAPEPTTTVPLVINRPATVATTTTPKVPLSNPQCPPGWYPESYDAARQQDPDRCVPDDPCSPDGTTTLWTLMPCAPQAVPAATTTAAAAVPQTLPATGDETGPIAVGAGLILAIGITLAAAARWVS